MCAVWKNSNKRIHSRNKIVKLCVNCLSNCFYLKHVRLSYSWLVGMGYLKKMYTLEPSGLTAMSSISLVCALTSYSLSSDGYWKERNSKELLKYSRTCYEQPLLWAANLLWEAAWLFPKMTFCIQNNLIAGFIVVSLMCCDIYVPLFYKLNIFTILYIFKESCQQFHNNNYWYCIYLPPP